MQYITNQASLEFIWFFVFMVLLTGYAVLDGFDLGVGMVHLFAKKDEERRLMLNSIGPVWDGNEVWLVTAGGALFAGFPGVYATFCSAFYSPIMLLLTGIIFRAIAIEVRSKQTMLWWRWLWDVLFSFASLTIAFALGFVVGNLIRGIPLDSNQEFIGDFDSFMHPYPILVGMMTSALFAMHGCIYVLMKTEGELHDKLRQWINPAIIVFIIFYAITTMSTLIYMPHMTEAIKDRPIFFVVGLLNMLAIANIPREIQQGRDGLAFISSCFSIICLVGLFAIGAFPNVIRAINDPKNLSITIYNSASSTTTLEILLLMAVIGIPIVAAYTISVYWIFHGKVKLDSSSY